MANLVRMRTARWVAALAAAVLAVVLSACVPTPAPTPTTTGFASEEEAFAAAEATYRAYVDALNDVDLSDPATFEPVFALSTDPLLGLDRTTLSQYHAEDVTFVGASKVTLLAPIQWNPASGIATLATCLDVSAIDVLDRNGSSLVTEGRSDIQPQAVSLTTSGSTNFAVAEIHGRDGEPTCSG